uniref:Uncharacterized protein n=1 Tax=viral metagenome TaxID=1070528 RepID=A0A6C0M1G8_9ZZZZ
MKCSICGEKGHNRANTKFHPKNTPWRVDTVMKISMDKVCECIRADGNQHVVLLRNREVVQWVFGDTSFLPGADSDTNKQRKKSEDEWGNRMLRCIVPDKDTVQWTTVVGETIVKEINMLLGYTVNIPKPLIDGVRKYQLDAETSAAIIEIKAATYFTGGTANEKILGTPAKYVDVPGLCGKPLMIICIGRAEKEIRDKYGFLPGKACGKNQRDMLERWKSGNIELVGASDILRSLCK